MTNIWQRRNGEKREGRKLQAESGRSQTHEVVDEAFLLLHIGDGGADSHVVRQLVEVTNTKPASSVYGHTI